MSDGDTPRKKRGRPAGKPLSPAELAARRNNPRKTGAHSTSVARRILPPCTRDACPAEFPCELKLAAEADGRVVEGCLVHLASDPAIARQYREALIERDFSGVQRLSADMLARFHLVVDRDLNALLEEDSVVEEIEHDHEGNVRKVTLKKNPLWDVVKDGMTTLGVDGKQQAITPAASGEKNRDDGLADLVNTLAEKQKLLKEGRE